MPLERLYDFSPGTVIRSAEIDAEFDQIIALVNGTTTDDTVAIGGSVDDSPFADPRLYVEGQAVFQDDNSGLVLGVYKKGSAVLRVGLYNSGEVRTTAGNQAASPSDQVMTLGGCLGFRTGNIGNVGAGEDILWSITIKANTFSNGGSRGCIVIKERGYTGANANNKTIKFKVTSSVPTTTLIASSGAVAFNNKPYFLDAEVGLDTDGIGSLTVTGTFKCDATEVRFNIPVTGIDFTQDWTISLTGEATADNDIVSNQTLITKFAGSGF